MRDIQVAVDLESQDANSAALPVVWRCKGFVQCVSEGNLAEPELLQVDAVNGILRMTKVEQRQGQGMSCSRATGRTAPPAGLNMSASFTGTNPTSELLFIGWDLDAAAVNKLADRCRPRLLPTVPLRTVSVPRAVTPCALLPLTPTAHRPPPGQVAVAGGAGRDSAGAP